MCREKPTQHVTLYSLLEPTLMSWILINLLLIIPPSFFFQLKISAARRCTLMGMSSWQCRSRPTMHFHRTKLICVWLGLCDCVCVSLQCLMRSRYMTVICFRGSANTTWPLRANVSIKTLIQGDNHTNVQIMKHKDTDITQMAHTHK